MRKVKLFLCGAVITGSTIIACSQDIKSVKIGNQEWMAGNLSVDKFRNGDPIPQVKTQSELLNAGYKKQPAWCYYDNDSAKGDTYGKLYNWYAVNDPRGLAPVGWHVPNDAEWTQLTEYLGGKEVAGIKMKSGSDKTRKEKNNLGFSGLPGGRADYFDDPFFQDLDTYGQWWSSAEYNSENAWLIILDFAKGTVNIGGGGKMLGISVRCLKDYKKGPEEIRFEAESLIKNANNKLDSEDYTGAILDCNKALEINPKLESALALRGSANRLLGNFQDAVNDYDAALTINPAYARAYYLRARAKVGLKNFQEAILDYNRALELDLKMYEAYWMRAESKMMLKDYQGAIDDLSVYLEEDPNAQAYLNRGLAKSALEKHSAAISDYTKTFDILFAGDFVRDFQVHEDYWPSLDKMLVIGNSFKKVLSKSSSEKFNNNHIVGKWAMDRWSGGDEIIEFKENGKLTSTWDRYKNNSYEVLYHFSNSSIIRIDSLKDSKSIPYGYFLAKNFTTEDNAGNAINQIALYLIPNGYTYTYASMKKSSTKTPEIVSPVENVYENCEPRFIGGCFDWNTNAIRLDSINWKLESNCFKSNYTSISTTLTKGIATPMEIDNGNWCGVAVWIDFDQNGVFEQTENMYHAGEGVIPGEKQHFAFNITIPPTTPNGIYKMRVISGWGTDCFTPTPGSSGYGACGIYQHGNFVDFTIRVKD